MYPMVTSLDGDPEFAGEEVGEDHELLFVDRRAFERVDAGDPPRCESAQVDAAEACPFELEVGDRRLRERDALRRAHAKVEFVDRASAELDIGELRRAEIEVGDPAVLDDDLLPHAVEAHPGPDPAAADLRVEDVRPRHRQGVGTGVDEADAGEAHAREVGVRLGVAESHPGEAGVEERRASRIHLGEVEVGEVQSFEELLGPDIAEHAIG